jgi:hypothetical protein
MPRIAVVPEALGREVVAAVEQRDWPRLAACMSPTVVFRAVVQNESNPFREHHGPEAASAQVARWFDDGDPHELLDSDVGMVADRLHVRYRVRNREDGRWLLVEQHVFATVGADGIRNLDLVCSGFREIAPPD